MSLPKVSVVIPYSVDRGWLNEAIESVKRQTYKGEIELILSQSNNNVSHNINQGIKKATGDYIKYLCEDDWLTDNSIDDSVKAMQGNDFIHGVSFNVLNGVKQLQFPKHTRFTIEDMLKHNIIHGGTLMYRRDVFDKVGYFDESLTCAEEYEFNLRCLQAGMNIGFTNKVLYNYRRHNDQKSLGKNVNQNERKLKIDAIKERYKKKDLKIIVGIATIKGREESLKKTIQSLDGQVDEIHVFHNNEQLDYTDNAKFYPLENINEPCYFFSCDDDLTYPKDYVNKMINAIDKYKTIVTLHGRKLKGLNLSYYRGHKTYNCLTSVGSDEVIDVAGTGVTAFRTDYFLPKGLIYSNEKKMSDIVFSLIASMQEKKITVINHSPNYITQNEIDKSKSIHCTESKNEQRQIELTNEIWKLNYQKK